MKIERINENQFRCTLTRSDLADREIKISELAYGSEKAHTLFNDLLAKAMDELGFEADDAPLMVEAIPISSECLILIVTKVDDPEELDTRFSNFTASYDADSDTDESSDDADEIFDLFNQIRQSIASISDAATVPAEPLIKEITKDTPESTDDAKLRSCACVLDSLDTASDLANRLPENLKAETMLYKQPSDGKYLLMIDEVSGAADDYRTICVLCAEFGHIRKTTAASRSFFSEHYETIIRQQAIEVLRSI